MTYRNFWSRSVWFEIRQQVLSRDNYRCRAQNCNETENLGIHHIIPYRISHDNSLKNLISFCKSCHKKADNQFLRLGVTNYVKQMIAENERRQRNDKA